MDTVPDKPRITAEEYFRTSPETNTPMELIDGEIVALAAPDRLHQRISGRMFAIMDGYIRANNGKCEADQAIDVKLNDDTVVVPDLLVVCDPDKLNDHGVDGAPDWVIEIASTNRNDDFIRKLALYQESGVREYWIVDPKYSRTLVYFFEQNDYPNIYTFDTPIPVRIWGGKLSITIAELETL